MKEKGLKMVKTNGNFSLCFRLVWRNYLRVVYPRHRWDDCGQHCWCLSGTELKFDLFSIKQIKTHLSSESFKDRGEYRALLVALSELLQLSKGTRSRLILNIYPWNQEICYCRNMYATVVVWNEVLFLTTWFWVQSRHFGMVSSTAGLWRLNTCKYIWCPENESSSNTFVCVSTVYQLFLYLYMTPIIVWQALFTVFTLQ